MRFILLVLATLFLFGCTAECPDEGVPVCADGFTYPSECHAKAAGVEDYEIGQCPTCFDSDGGKDIFTAGSTVNDDLMEFDSCEGNSVKEYYCSDDEPASNIFPCPPGYECKTDRCVEMQCSDSDGGEDVMVYGKVISGNASETDSCSGDFTVNEFYCSNGEIGSKKIDCPDLHECKSGRCVESRCTDSDGKDTSRKGTTKLGSEISTDSCLDGDVKEYFCTNNRIESDVISCASGFRCDDGKCVKDVCTDNDGKEVSTKGTTSYGGKSYEDSCYSDIRVLEYFCESDTEVDSTRIYCPAGYECDDGRCREGDCFEDRDDLSEENQRYQIEESDDEVRLYENDVLELDGDYILVLDDVGSNLDFLLYEDYDEYSDKNEICEFSMDEDDNITDPCDENVGDIETGTIGSDYAEVTVESFKIVQYIDTVGYESTWSGSSVCPDDSVVMTEQTSDFLPYLETSGSGIDLSNEKFRFLDDFAYIDEMEDDGIRLEFDGENYYFQDNDVFTYGEFEYKIDITFNERGISRIKLTKD